MWILMDTVAETVKRELGIDFVKDLLTVHSFLSDRDGLGLLGAGGVDAATRSLSSDCSREQQRAEAQAKAAAARELCAEFQSASLSEEDIMRVLDSISDNNSYLAFNVRPVERMIGMLKAHFDRSKEDPNFSLELTTKPKKRPSDLYGSSYFSSFTSYVYGGHSASFNGSGSHLTHSHSMQYSFVLQSLTLWAEIMRHMPKLWTLAEEDMLSQPYRLW